jgi:hypothetical protein
MWIISTGLFFLTWIVSSSTHAKLETLQQGNDDKLETVHRRIDGLQVTGVLAIISFIITIILAVFVKGPTMPKEINLKVSDEQVRVFCGTGEQCASFSYCMMV